MWFMDNRLKNRPLRVYAGNKANVQFTGNGSSIHANGPWLCDTCKAAYDPQGEKAVVRTALVL